MKNYAMIVPVYVLVYVLVCLIKNIISCTATSSNFVPFTSLSMAIGQTFPRTDLKAKFYEDNMLLFFLRSLFFSIARFNY